MAGDDVTRDELREGLRDLREALESTIERTAAHIDGHLREVNQHLRTLNGRVGAGEVARGELGVRVTNVEREVFRRRRDDTTTSAIAVPVPDGRAITRRDVLIVAYTLTAASAILGALWGLLQVVRP